MCSDLIAVDCGLVLDSLSTFGNDERMELLYKHMNDKKSTKLEEHLHIFGPFCYRI